MKPGAKKLFDFLQQYEILVVKDYKRLFESKSTLLRIVKEYSNVFSLKDECISLKKNETELETEVYLQARQTVHSELQRFLVGPFEENEELGSYKRPMQLYLTGKLVPFGSTGSVEDEREEGIETGVIIEDDSIEDRLSSRQMFRPSSMGLSFKMRSLGPIIITANWATYDGDTYKRTPHTLRWTVELKNDVQKEELSYSKVNPLIDKAYPGQLHYSWIKRNGLYHVSVFLLNNYARESYPEQFEIMFQTALDITVKTQDVAVFQSVADRFNVADELLYREHTELATGHGVGVDWQKSGEEMRLFTTWLPFYELPVVEHTTIPDEVFDMKSLSELPAKVLKTKLDKLPLYYEQWLANQKEYIQTLVPHLQEEAMQNVEQVEKIISRLKEGITLVCSSDEALEKKAFQFANEAMLIQRAQTQVASIYRSTGKRVPPIYDGNWRLFQIIFLLMNVAGISDEEHEDRDVVDLIWFPTGGGKTEAYLGVAAYTMAYRRLAGNVNDVSSYAGVTVLMRYTLRLLTTQQFQRAAALICAMENIRIRNVHLYGELPFSIGLWVGTDSSPNLLSDAQEKLDLLRDGQEVKTGNPMQLLNCPWCGTELTAHDYQIKDDTQHICCHEPTCLFHHKLPIYTVDEAIYQHVPTLVIGTVDKIAQLPWKKDMFELFGRKNLHHSLKGFAYKDKGGKRGYVPIKTLAPPALIIQDELHLISGPLGSLTALYEVAVDILTSREGKKAKVIASTATIRGAKEQIRHLYGRDYLQFPLAVQKQNDTFVSREVPVTEKSGRLYVGVCSPGVSNKIQAIQLFAALAVITRSNLSKAMDPYYTMLGYFNTVKELSGMLTTFQDEIVSRLDVLDSSKIFEHSLVVEEMTSRRKAYEIPQLLAQMEKQYDDEQALDAVLATNMISVGVDVDRLGLMVVQGQPKTTSEYIQATSRVGRKYPGIVITTLNPMRSRDLSHFEQFRSYHQSLYRHVEAMSVTPFASGALYKGLRGALVGVIRQSLLELSKEQSANAYVRSDELEQLIERFIQRAVETQLETSELTQEIENILDWWQIAADKYAEKGELSYKKNLNNGKPHLLRQFGEKGRGDVSMPAMMSLRNVEGSIEVEVKRK
ncbi:DISARM system helicase DrmA [Metasolibacillus meyeri]|uniref:DISARM system helicase DrmA n=1 Tax=Metasolibacillus meyeri TaxID=1071052 RepID=UPI000D2F51D3|nr:DISARM system helicase DrmA [Metasolibacillus meyeri]